MWLGEDKRRFDHIQVHFQILQDKRLDAYDIAVYVALVMHAEVQTGKCWPSAETVAGYLGSSAKTVRRCIKTLVTTGYVSLDRRAGEASIYYLLPPPDIHTLDPATDLGPVRQALRSGPRRPFTLDPATDEQEPITKTINESDKVVFPQRDVCDSCGFFNDPGVASGARCVCDSQAS